MTYSLTNGKFYDYTVTKKGNSSVIRLTVTRNYVLRVLKSKNHKLMKN